MKVREQSLNVEELNKYWLPIKNIMESNRAEIASVVLGYRINQMSSLARFLQDSSREASGNEVQDFLGFYQNNRLTLESQNPLICEVAEKIKEIIIQYIDDFGINKSDLSGLRQINLARAVYKQFSGQSIGWVFPAHCNDFAAMTQAIKNFGFFPELEDYFKDKSMKLIGSWTSLGR